MLQVLIAHLNMVEDIKQVHVTGRCTTVPAVTRSKRMHNMSFPVRIATCRSGVLTVATSATTATTLCSSIEVLLCCGHHELMVAISGEVAGNVLLTDVFVVRIVLVP